MGRDLHITRSPDWTESESSPITEAEWLAFVGNDPEIESVDALEASGAAVRPESRGSARWSAHPKGVSVRFDLREGRIDVKNPDEATIAKMVAAAAGLGAHVVGDDGEVYEAPGRPPRPPSPSVGHRFASWFQRFRGVAWNQPPALPLQVGDRVRDAHGLEGEIVSVDVTAEHGHGLIRVRFDDGREITYAASAHGLTRVDEDRPGGSP